MPALLTSHHQNHIELAGGDSSLEIRYIASVTGYTNKINNMIVRIRLIVLSVLNLWYSTGLKK